MSAGSAALTQLKETLASEKTAPPLSLSSLPPRLSRLFVALGNAVHCVAGLRLIVCQFELWHIRGPNPSPRTPPPPTEQRRTFKAPAVGSFCCSQSFLTVGSSVSRERRISIGNSFPCKSASTQKTQTPTSPHPTHTYTHTPGEDVWAAASRWATDRNYCWLSSEIGRCAACQEASKLGFKI